ncbi:hypothetical protein MKX03_025219 [Papaver bracteatum]|nr:hypothetical protein MKX03_025219 [Papaver bracteatum]
MAVIGQTATNVWDRVLEVTKIGRSKGVDPAVWVTQISSVLSFGGVSLPSTELANLLVSYICWDNNVPISWKFLEKALTAKMVNPMLVLALLSSRVIPRRRSQPAAYRLFMELTKRHAFSFASQFTGSNDQKCMKAIDDALHLSEIFGLQASEAGVLVVEFVFSIVWKLVDATLDDEGLLELTLEKKSRWATKPQDMEIDGDVSFSERITEHHERLQKPNTVFAIDLIGQFLQNKLTSRLLFLARENMQSHWEGFIQRLRLLGAQSSALRSSNTITPETLLQLSSDTRKILCRESKGGLQQEFHAVLASGSLSSSAHSCSSIWLPLDLFLEDTNDGSLVLATSASEILTGFIKSLQAVNGTTWHDTFLGLWFTAIRHVQRERDPIEGPVPRLDTRLCLLLSITTLAIANIIEEEEDAIAAEKEQNSMNSQWTDRQVVGNRRLDLVSSLKSLGDYEALLAPPQSIISAANQAAAKAMMFVSGLSVESGYFDCISISDMPMNCSELEKIFEIAINGSDDEKVSAATILCGASLVRGWNIQEHTVRFVTELLSPPVPADYSRSESHLIAYAPLLNTLLVGMAAVDLVQILSLHGLVPQLAGALIAICEIFGSCVPSVSWILPTGEEINAHSVFSNAFTLLLRLWKFNYPPLEHVIGDVPPVWSHLTLEYLLLVRNSQLVVSGDTPTVQSRSRRKSLVRSSSFVEPFFVDSFPKLKVWYRQHQACLASTLSGLVHGTPVHQIVDNLLSMMFRKTMNKSGNQPLTSGSSSSSGPGSEDSSLRPKIPAWEIMEAVPFVVDAALTACSHGRLSPRELATGLKDLADFLPASLGTIISYFSAEVTRGIWKPAFMNGTDWPSPAANLSSTEEQIKRIVAATGVDVPSLVAGGSSPATLPLPLAAFVSLTITYKLDKDSERFLNLAGPALENLAAGCPWPCMPIVSSLWVQKVKRWSDFLIFSASRTVFHHNKDAVVQLLKSCFTATLGLSGSPLTSNGGVGALLGHGFGSHFSGGFSPVAPGILYLRVYRCIRNIMFMTEVILSLLMDSVKEIAASELQRERMEKLKRTKYGTRYGQISLAAAMKQVKLAASLGASLVWLSGGAPLAQCLIQETLPSWFLSVHGSEQEGSCGGMGAMLGGYALAYFAVMCGTFAWGVESVSTASKRRPKVIRTHFQFLASVLDGKISLGCDCATWRAYMSGFLTLMVACTPEWLLEVDVDILKRLCKGLRNWNEEELAVALLGRGGNATMGAAAELIVSSSGE